MSSCCDPTPKKEKTSTSCCASEPKPTTSSCCAPKPTDHQHQDACCPPEKKGSIDWMMYSSIAFVSITYALYLINNQVTELNLPNWLNTMADTSFEMFNAMWWGLLLGIVLVGWLNRIPREVIISVLGKGHTKQGIVRATLAGVMLDLCNHGILMVAMKLYERGASLGQVMAFLIASPWNSFTLTLILIGLVGLKLTLSFIVFSMVIAWVSGIIFDKLEMKGIVPTNPNKTDLPDDYHLKSDVKRLFKEADHSAKAYITMLKDGLVGSKMVMRWIFFGVVLVAFLRAFVPMDIFETWFGATSVGLLLTLLAATIIEVCSEGSTPIAADLVTRANAPGNAFTFLMAGASTDYTEIMAIKDTMKSWKIALFLPLVTVPQILFIGWLLNNFA
ncbi:permease [Catenovulum sp. 2E275]|uniref:permease n=1 Tax=Catenovulum sp. 2E275 TaxID=2980497 RepID=UPI0021D3534B|nr:permease [Catenovulum sp. 2E275]MCU4675188.1 permease [Catenovulum sp. 2E275]